MQAQYCQSGQTIVWDNLLDGLNVKLDRGNRAIADSFTFQTDEPDVFVGGDVYTGPKFAIDAISAGKQGLFQFTDLYSHTAVFTIGRDPHYFVELNKDDINIENYDNLKQTGSNEG